jgi:hypothetical protein
MWKVDVEIVRWDVRALGEVTQIAEIALIDDLGVISRIHPIHFKGFRFIDQIKERRERIAKTDTTAAAMTDVIDTLEFSVQRVFIPKFLGFPAERMPGRGIDTSFTHGVALTL